MDIAEAGTTAAVISVIGAVIIAGMKLFGDSISGRMEERIREHERNCPTADTLMELMAGLKSDIRCLSVDMKSHVQFHLDHLEPRDEHTR